MLKIYDFIQKILKNNIKVICEECIVGLIKIRNIEYGKYKQRLYLSVNIKKERTNPLLNAWAGIEPNPSNLIIPQK